MKKLLGLLALAVVGCNVSEDCFKKSGPMSQKDFAVAPFKTIYVYPNISLVLAEGNAYSVVAKAGANVIDDISATVADSVLSLRDNGGCNLSRQYGGKTLIVTLPRLARLSIYSNTAQKISSAGPLTHDYVHVVAEDYFGGVGTGEIALEMNNSQLYVESNNIADFRITGQTRLLFIGFYDDLSRFDGAGLAAHGVHVFQRSSNDIIVKPVDSLTGNIYSTGNVICRSHPPVVNVARHYTGRVIFQD